MEELRVDQENFKLNLNKPLCVFDLETTGLKLGQDRIIEIAIIKVFPDGHKEELCHRVNPEMPIPAESTAIHGITDADVEGLPTFRDLASKIAEFIGNSDLCGYNSNRFDVPMLAEEFARVGVDFDVRRGGKRKMIDVQAIFYKMEPRTLSAAVRFYLNRSHEGAHSALDDTRATLEVLKAQILKYKDVAYEDRVGKFSYPVQNNMETLADFSTMTKTADLAGFIAYNDKGEEIFTFGKHKGKRVSDVFLHEPAYYDWMMNSDFPAYTKRLLTEIRLRNSRMQMQ